MHPDLRYLNLFCAVPLLPSMGRNSSVRLATVSSGAEKILLCHLMPMPRLSATYNVQHQGICVGGTYLLGNERCSNNRLWNLPSIEAFSLPVVWIFQVGIVLHNETIRCLNILSLEHRYVSTMWVVLKNIWITSFRLPSSLDAG